jgi:hypothetical protein
MIRAGFAVIRRRSAPMPRSPKTVLAGLTLIAAADAALAHGDHDWIRKGGYKGVDGTSCCGQDDCDRIPAAGVERTPHGYSLPGYGLFVPFRQTQTSEDGKYWICRDGKAMRCFFAPPPGS